MIVSRLQKDDGKDVIFMILEPGNINKLKRGEPIHQKLGNYLPGLNLDLIVGFSPDLEWVTEQLSCLPEVNNNQFVTIILASQERPEVVRDNTEQLVPADFHDESKNGNPN